MRHLRCVAVMAALFLPAAGTAMAQSTAPAGAEVYFVEPADGAKVKSPLRVVMGLKGMGVAPALVEWTNTGHHHLLVDKPLAATDKPVPNDAGYMHFGGGQTEAAVTLPPGQHTLQLVLGDHNHVPHTPPVMSKPISVTVE